MTTGPDPAPPASRPRRSAPARRRLPDGSRSRRAARSGSRRPSRSWRAAALAALAAAGLSACAVVPDSGSAQPGQVAFSSGGQGQDYLQLVPRAPQPGWSPTQVVLGFLTACASFADNHAVARQYLDPATSSSWHPGWAVTVVGTNLQLTSEPAYPQRGSGPSSQVDVVTTTGEKLASLTSTGQYVGSQGSSTHRFELSRIHGQWRIENPPGQLLLTEPDFKRVYAPRNLYFVADPSRALVPDPVFVPLEATHVGLANKLVTALLSSPQGWLAGAVSTAFPRGTKLLGQVTLANGTATVDLAGAAAGASRAVLGQMTDQLVWTLAGPSYGQSAIQSVNLEVNGHLRESKALGPGPGGPGMSVPEAPASTPLYATDASGRVLKLSGTHLTSRAVPGAAGQARVRLATIAVSPGGRYVAGLTRSRRSVFYGALRPGARLNEWQPAAGNVTSLSWDATGTLWAAGSGGAWMLRGGKAVPLGLGLQLGSVVSQLRVAPDGVRVAMIVHNRDWRGGPRLLLAAIGHGPGGVVALGPAVTTGDDVSNPVQLTWYGADNLVVLSRSPANSQLYEVPVNGGSSTQLITAPGTQSISAAGPANPLVAGLANGQLAVNPSLNGTWVTQQGVAFSPTYPG